MFNGETYSRAKDCRGHLITNQDVLIYTTHFNKCITRRYFFILRSKITEKQQQVRNFAEVRKFARYRAGMGLS